MDTCRQTFNNISGGVRTYRYFRLPERNISCPQFSDRVNSTLLLGTTKDKQNKKSTRCHLNSQRIKKQKRRNDSTPIRRRTENLRLISAIYNISSSIFNAQDYSRIVLYGLIPFLSNPPGALRKPRHRAIARKLVVMTTKARCKPRLRGGDI